MNSTITSLGSDCYYTLLRVRMAGTVDGLIQTNSAGSEWCRKVIYATAVVKQGQGLTQG